MIAAGVGLAAAHRGNWQAGKWKEHNYLSWIYWNEIYNKKMHLTKAAGILRNPGFAGDFGVILKTHKG